MESKPSIFEGALIPKSEFPNTLPLCLVEFSNGNYKHTKDIKINFRCYQSTNLNFLSRPRRILMASTNRLNYSGNNYETQMPKVTSTILKVGVYNKLTHRMKLYDADFFYMRPILKSATITSKLEKSKEEMAQELALTFGSKNQQRGVNSRLAYGKVSGDVSANVIASENIEIPIEEKQQSEIIPPQNKNAQSVDEVYNVNDIISEEEYIALDADAVMLTCVSLENLQSWKENNKFCIFILRYLEMKRQNLSLLNAKILCYLNYLIQFLKCTYKDLRRKDPIPDIPQPYKKNLFNNYLINRAMPPKMKDKLLAAATVIALNISNYRLNLNDWAQSTHIPMKRLVLMAYTLGCHVYDSKGEGVKWMELKLPLYQHVERTAKRKNK